ncbi:MAG: indole-3-glycerol phosphate synthase TrpC [Actinomycetota bacterium]|nr:indole-3-glycerol phosphate synthase TrpC [Actinomycetota bacterium]
MTLTPESGRGRPSFLDDLVAGAQKRVEAGKTVLTDDVLEQRLAAAPPPRSLDAALRGPGMSLIAEIKRASPLKGPLDLDLDAGRLARTYAEAGASALSVLTEPDGFKGSLDDMAAALGAGLPVLRKDFLVDPWQVMESRAAGADAVLLIARVVGDGLAELVAAARSLGMDALVEVHHEEELDDALGAGATLIGVNHRDLTTFEVDPERTAKLAPLIPHELPVVALSGVSERREVEELEAAGAAAVLVGEALVTATDPAAKLRELLGR